MAFVYMIELARPLGTERHQARYYLGSCKNLNRRMAQHRSGKGAAMLRFANEKGIKYWVCKFSTLPTEAEARQLERKLKARKNHASLLSKVWT
jgi:putative endonuclease